MTSNSSSTHPEVDQDILEHIRREWGDILGPYKDLLNKPGGLDEIAALIRRGVIGRQADR